MDIAVEMSVDTVQHLVITEHEIRNRAFHLWVKAGSPPEHDKAPIGFWDQALDQLKRESIQRLLQTVGQPTNRLPPECPPKLFVGSSTESVDVAKTIQLLLGDCCLTTIWKYGFFTPGQTTMQTLEKKLDDYDFAAFVLTPDDLTTSRGETWQAARDNILLEVGLSIGKLGSERTFLVHQETNDFKLPSDLAGITMLPFQVARNGDWEAVLGVSCTMITRSIKGQGRR